MASVAGGPLDMSKYEIYNPVLHKLASAPGSPVEAQVYYNTVDKLPYFWNGTAMVAMAETGGSSPSGPAGGDLDGTYPDPTIAAGVIVNADINASAAIALSKLATDPLARANHTGTQAISTILAAATARIFGRTTAGSGAGEELTAAQAKTILAIAASDVSGFDTQVRTNRLDQMAAPTAAVSMNNQNITNVLTPSASHHAVNKEYADGIAAGLSFKDAVQVVATSNATLATAYENGDTVDGVVLATGDRILLAGQTTASENGIYTVNASGAPTRAVDADASGEIEVGTLVYAKAGTANGGQLWVCSATGATPWVPGSSTSTWVMFFAVTSTQAGAGLTASGNVLSVGAGTGITVNANDVAIDTSVVYRKASGNLGDGVATDYVVSHSLNTRDVLVQVWRNSSPWDEIPIIGKEATSTTSVTIRFGTAPASNAYRYVIAG